jgi:hypothetical protein
MNLDKVQIGDLDGDGRNDVIYSTYKWSEDGPLEGTTELFFMRNLGEGKTWEKTRLSQWTNVVSGVEIKFAGGKLLYTTQQGGGSSKVGWFTDAATQVEIDAQCTNPSTVDIADDQVIYACDGSMWAYVYAQGATGSSTQLGPTHPDGENPDDMPSSTIIAISGDAKAVYYANSKHGAAQQGVLGSLTLASQVNTYIAEGTEDAPLKIVSIGVGDVDLDGDEDVTFVANTVGDVAFMYDDDVYIDGDEGENKPDFVAQEKVGWYANPACHSRDPKADDKDYEGDLRTNGVCLANDSADAAWEEMLTTQPGRAPEFSAMGTKKIVTVDIDNDGDLDHVIINGQRFAQEHSLKDFGSYVSLFRNPVLPWGHQLTVDKHACEMQHDRATFFGCVEMWMDVDPTYAGYLGSFVKDEIKTERIQGTAACKTQMEDSMGNTVVDCGTDRDLYGWSNAEWNTERSGETVFPATAVSFPEHQDTDGCKCWMGYSTLPIFANRLAATADYVNLINQMRDLSDNYEHKEAGPYFSTSRKAHKDKDQMTFPFGIPFLFSSST